MSLKIKLRGTAECLMCRQHWLRIKGAFTHTNCKVLQQQQLPLLCSVRQCLRCSVTCQPSMAADQFMVLQELAAQAALGRFVLLAQIIPESSGRSLRSAAPCKRERLNRGSRAIAHDEMLHSAGAELACAVLHCRERQSCSKKQLSLTTDANSTRLLCREALLKN